MRSFLIIVTVFGASSLAIAGPSEGEMFGYRVGAKYPVGDSTRGYYTGSRGSMVVIAEKPEIPSDFERLELITTSKTFTVATIYALAEFANQEKAKAFALRYADLLKTQHSAKCTPLEAYLKAETLRLLCGDRFELGVLWYKRTVQVSLRFGKDSEAGRHLDAQFDSEMRQLESEGKRSRLEKALKEQALKGLQ